MKRRLRLITTIGILILLWIASPSIAMAKGWETVNTEKAQTQHVVSDSEIEIRAGGGMIYVNTSRHLNIKIFTILGSRISEDNLAPGTYQFVVPTHGVYIIKAGDLTCKVAV